MSYELKVVDLNSSFTPDGGVSIPSVNFLILKSNSHPLHFDRYFHFAKVHFDGKIRKVWREKKMIMTLDECAKITPNRWLKIIFN